MKNHYQRIVSLPQVEKLPITDESYPLGDSRFTVEPLDLSEWGYIEEEYTISGFSNVYVWPEGQLLPDIRTSDVPYTSRILIRRPEYPKKFSGNVIVELCNWAYTYDRGVAGWGQCWRYFMNSGDIWIGVTVRDRAIKALKTFDPERYKALSLTNPLPPEQRGEPATSYGKVYTEMENGLVWDMISQLGALIKSHGSSNPLFGFDVKCVMVTGATAGDLSAYVAAIHPLATLDGQKPVYDGYLIYMTGSPGGLNVNEGKMSELDERCKLYCSVPVIRILTCGDILGGGYHPDWSYMQRRPDGDAPGEQFRLYEVAGAGVLGLYYRQRDPKQKDVEKAGVEWKPFEKREFEFPIRYIIAGAFENLKKWIREGTLPPKADRVAVEKEYPNTEFVLDELGNVKGGLRNPYVDAPLYCFQPEGGATRLSDEMLSSLYKSKEDYLAKVTKSTLRMLTEGWIIPDDALEIIIEASQENIPVKK